MVSKEGLRKRIIEKPTAIIEISLVLSRRSIIQEMKFGGVFESWVSPVGNPGVDNNGNRRIRGEIQAIR